MILSKDVFAQGTRAGARLPARAGFVSRRALTAAIGPAPMHASVLGGVLAAPILSLVGWVGLVLPVATPLHQIASTLITMAVIWLVLAIIGAHVFHGERRPRGY